MLLIIAVFLLYRFVYIPRLELNLPETIDFSKYQVL